MYVMCIVCVCLRSKMIVKHRLKIRKSMLSWKKWRVLPAVQDIAYDYTQGKCARRTSRYIFIFNDCNFEISIHLSLAIMRWTTMKFSPTNYFIFFFFHLKDNIQVLIH